MGPSVWMFTKYEFRVRGSPPRRTRSARYSCCDTSSMRSPKMVGLFCPKGCTIQCQRRDDQYFIQPISKSTRAHHVPKPSIASSNLVLVPGLHVQAHFSPEQPGCLLANLRVVLRVLVQVQVYCGVSTNVSVASSSVLADVVSRVEREERAWCARRQVRALH